MKKNGMNTGGAPGDHSGAGLADASQRSLMRQILWVTGVTLSGFSILQFLSGHPWFATLELLASSVLLWGAWRIIRVENLTPWIYLYLLPTFSFLIYIIVMPDASATAFVWVYTIPLLSYLLLGKVRGFLLTTPFVVVAVTLYLQRFQIPQSAAGLIDLGNALLCGVLVMVFVHLYESRRAAAHTQLKRLAQIDALTGVANRGSFQNALERSIQDAQRRESRLVLVILDVDHFKEVNDRWGHDAGDMALRHICDCLQQRLRVTDSLGRLGGEEFGLLLRDISRAEAEPLVQSLREKIASSKMQYGHQLIPLSATFGLAEWPTDSLAADELYRCADKRLYQGKQLGRNRVIVHDDLYADLAPD
jgi:diguanylate cyclase (GGDEF)-like protein